MKHFVGQILTLLTTCGPKIQPDPDVFYQIQVCRRRHMQAKRLNTVGFREWDPAGIWYYCYYYDILLLLIQ